MPANRKVLGAAALSLALAGGGVAGAVLGTPNVSSAQDATTESTTGTGDIHPGGIEHGGVGLAAAAGAIGISEDDLRTALADGQSIAQVAEGEGVDVQTVIDAMVADATERLDAAIADLPDRLTDLVHRAGLPEGPAGGRPGGWGPRGGPGLDAAAAAIGVSADDLVTALRDGSTIAAVATAHDVEVQTVIDALVADAETHLDEAVAAGRIDADGAADQKADLADRMTALVNGELPDGHGPGGPPFLAS